MRNAQLLVSNVKLESQQDQEDDNLLGLGLSTKTIQNNPTSTQFTGLGEMDVEDQLLDSDTFFSSQMSELDFDLLNDFNLPSELLFQDRLLCSEDSNSGSQTSTSDLGYVDPFSVSDSSPVSPPSPSVSDYGSGSSGTFPPVSTYPHERVNTRLSTSSNSSSSMETSILIPSGPLTQAPSPHLNLGLSMPRSGRGRSASHDTPDVQAMKRHIRMIRNRESACLSRKKKKDYVVSLEGQLKELEAENAKLKQENAMLHARLRESGNQVTGVRFIGTPRQNPPSTQINMLSKSRKPPSVRTVAKLALLSLCCFMFVCFRSPSPSPSDKFSFLRIPNDTIPPSKSMLNPPVNILPGHEDILPKEPPLPSNLIRSRRSYRLWGETEESGNVNGTLPRPSKEVPKSRVNSRNSQQSGTIKTPYGIPPSLNPFMNESTNRCPLHFNQTEAMRVQNDLKGIFKKSSKKNPRMTKPLVYSLMDLGLGLAKENNKGLGGTGVQVYDEKMQKYSGVLEKLQRRDDTFYVVSLAVDNQLLLSANAHNESSRPKMSFLMPWKNDTLGGKEELMQIDCEVTRVFNLNSPKTKKRNRN